MYGTEDALLKQAAFLNQQMAQARDLHDQLERFLTHTTWNASSATAFCTRARSLNTLLLALVGRCEEALHSLNRHVSEVKRVKGLISAAEAHVQQRVAAARALVERAQRAIRDLPADQVSLGDRLLIFPTAETHNLATVSVLEFEGKRVTTDSFLQATRIASLRQPQPGSLEWLELKQLFDSRGW
ncbi:hypothetical protein [Lysinibacter sp. HNR]|uniref:hypothetical protein n=1 Tax=Lysinibacter sp. HNR TaxID=3031408 RepID=UPI002435BBD7|nr:hypothetical protein [Lysinibacter sp. HNR]WGD36753.1 hypothetical protein FrondiHNR_09835 [Lysinibacter sp. HNR]